MNAYNVIKRPLVTEKASSRRETANQYQFEIDPSATKLDVKRAVEKIFKVHVEGVRVANVHGKAKRNPRSRKKTRVASLRKAYITLKKGDKIEVFEGV